MILSTSRRTLHRLPPTILSTTEQTQVHGGRRDPGGRAVAGVEHRHRHRDAIGPATRHTGYTDAESNDNYASAHIDDAINGDANVTIRTRTMGASPHGLQGDLPGGSTQSPQCPLCLCCATEAFRKYGRRTDRFA